MQSNIAVTRGPDSAEPTRTRLYALFWRWHFFAALIVIPFVLWQSTTGVLYLWSEWWMDVVHPELRFVDASDHNMPPSRQIAAALADAPRASMRTHGVSPVGHSHGPVSASASSSSAAAGAGSSSSVIPAGGPPVQGILLSDDPRRSTIVLLQDAGGLPYPIFVNPHDAHVLGKLSAYAWLPGFTRALHGGWPIKPAGSWLLELGDGWAIVTLLTGLYLWWPRGRGLAAGLRPRLRTGTRILLRDLHACVAVWFSIVLLFFLVSALPWTDFWGGQLLTRAERALDQVSPAGFSPGGASTSQMAAALPSVDQVVATERAHHVAGTLDMRLAPWPGSPLFTTTVHNWPGDDRTLLADPRGGTILGEFGNSDLPVIPRLVALGVHVHQGDFGLFNVWLNTAFAVSLIWLSATGIASWWMRKPRRTLGIPPKTHVPKPRSLVAIAAMLCVLLPLFGASVVCIYVTDLVFGRKLARAAAADRR